MDWNNVKYWNTNTDQAADTYDTMETFNLILSSNIYALNKKNYQPSDTFADTT